MVIKKTLSNQLVFFALGLVFFLIAAVFGWEKLHYGFSFLDEGLHMTDSWRLVAGDHFLKDKLMGAHMLYTLINSLIFRACPDITLLGFREVQYFITVCLLVLFSISLFRVDKQYWYFPFVFSLFAFTGLDPRGVHSNLSYHTYPHLFVTLYLSFLILGIYQQKTIVKRSFYVASGLSLWGISLTLLHLSIIAFSPILLFLVSKKLKLKSFPFKFNDLCYVLAPFLFCWLVFIAIYNRSYIMALSTSIGLSVETHWTLTDINWDALMHIGITLSFLIIYAIGVGMLRTPVFILCLAVMSLVMFFIIDTSFFYLISPYYRGWFSRPMWFSSLFMAFFLVFLFSIVKKYRLGKEYNKGEELAIILLIPSTLLALGSIIFSSAGVLKVLCCSIPAVAAITSVVLYHKNVYAKSYSVKLLVIIMFFLPFYYTAAWADWKFTYFDVSPELADVEIESGFGKGIKTNSIYYDLYKWIRLNTKRYTQKNDFMISYVVTPMAYIISKRRPALDHSFTCFASKPPAFYEKSIEKMKMQGRLPKIAFVFEMPAFFPVTLKENKYWWFPKQFIFPSQDPISKYIMENMTLVEEYKISEGNTARCFVDRKAVKDEGFTGH
jgi:hypothetical protein